MLSQIKIISVYLLIINVVHGIDSEYELSTNENELTNTEDELIKTEVELSTTEDKLSTTEDGSSNNEEEIGSGVNEIDLPKCKHLTTSNNSYIFYPVEDIINEGGFFLRFNVRAERGVHIIFSPTNLTANSDHKGFEVVISVGEDNAISMIRTTQASKKNTTHTHIEKNMVSSKEWRQFWIRITSDGTLIEVGKNGSIPFMSSRTEPRLIEYYGFASDNDPINYAFLCFERNNIDVSKYRTLTTYDDAYTFFPIEEIKNDGAIFLEFLVKTDLDANIVFAPTNETMKKDEKIFNVILGDHTNTISAIKTSELDEPGSKHHEGDILSPDEWRSFWIRITQDGASIEVGKNGSSAFMSLNTEPGPIKYYGFTSTGTFANWAFPSLKNNNIVTNMCNPSPCGPNSECKQKHNRAICSCKKNQLDSPSTCRFECIFNSECPQNKACIGKTCQDPCEGMCGKNTTCEVDSHFPICSCSNGTTGDPLAGCVTEEDLPKYRSLTTYTGGTFYPISVIENDDQIFMKFNVKAEKNARILFSTTNQFGGKDFKIYGVTLGTEEQKTNIDSIDLQPSSMTYSEYNLLSNEEWRPFWIRITPDGSLIEIGKNIGKLPFVSLKKDPWPIKYFGFSSDGVCHWNFISSKDTNKDHLRYTTHLSSSAYSTLYPITDIDTRTYDEFFLEFNVLGKHSARIIFTEKNDPEISAISKNDMKYQDVDIFLVVIDDTHLAIRTTPDGEEQARYDAENLISSKEWHKFWIRIAKDGSSIEIGEGGRRASTSLKTKPRIIKYVGFSGGEDIVLWTFPPETDFPTCRHVTFDTYLEIFNPIEEIKNEGGYFIKFNVKSENSANVLFSQENNFRNCYDNIDGVTEHCIKIVISFSDTSISWIGPGPYRPSHYGTDLTQLSSKEWRQFWIRITSDGSLIEVGKNGSPPFMAYRMQPWIINYYGMFVFNEHESADYAFLCFENNNIDLSQYRTLTTYDDAYTFYSIKDIKNDEGFFFEFMVKADQDAHIIFSPTNETVEKDQRVFKIILGGYTTSTISVIKTTEHAEPASEHHDKDILSPDEWRPFWIRITQDGESIEVGKNGSSAFMSLKTEPRPIKYYGFSSNGAFANWAFPSLKNNNIVTNMCNPSPCGPNSECKQKHNRAICSCKKNQLDSPSTCRFECIFNSECPQNKACIGKTCQDPCEGMCGKNTTCEVDSHFPICSCSNGTTGDPLEGCVIEEDLPKYRRLTTHLGGTTFYPINVIKNESEIFLKFNTKCEETTTIEAYIIFSSTNQPYTDDHQYAEVALSSTESRTRIKSNPPLSTMYHHWGSNFLSNNIWHPFWIRISPDGSSIELGTNIGRIAFMSLKKDPSPIKYFGFLSYDVCHWNFVSSKDTNIDLLRYRTHESDSSYSTLYPITDLEYNDDEFFLEFNLKAKHSARIIFTEKNDPKISGIPRNDANYQGLDIFNVVIEKTHLAIQTTPDGEEQVKYYEENLISSQEWRIFWIRITKDGSSIEVGKNGGPTLASLKTKPRIIKYFGFSSDGSAEWAFPPQIAKFLIFF